MLALALVAHPSVEIDECLDLIVADRGGRDDVAAVGVADKHDRTGERPQQLGEVARVASEVAKRVGEPDNAESFAHESADLGVEARRISPCAVDKDNRRFVFVRLGSHVSSSRAPCVVWTAASSVPHTLAAHKLVDKSADQTAGIRIPAKSSVSCREPRSRSPAPWRVPLRADKRLADVAAGLGARRQLGDERAFCSCRVWRVQAVRCGCRESRRALKAVAPASSAPVRSVRGH